jgi:hypothetical protein
MGCARLLALPEIYQACAISETPLRWPVASGGSRPHPLSVVPIEIHTLVNEG